MNVLKFIKIKNLEQLLEFLEICYIKARKKWCKFVAKSLIKFISNNIFKNFKFILIYKHLK